MKRLHPMHLAWAVMALALVLGLANNDGHGIWHDERVSLTSAEGLAYRQAHRPAEEPFYSSSYNERDTWSATVRMTVEDNGNSIGYNLFLHAWSQLVPVSDGWMRAPGAFALVLMVFYTLLWVRLISDSVWLALLAALLVALHPLLLQKAQEIRAYLPAGLTVLAATYHFWRLFGPESNLPRPQFRRQLICYTGWLTLAVMVHYLTVTVLAFHGVYLLLANRRFRVWGNYLLTLIAPTLALAIWMMLGGWEGLQIMSVEAEAWVKVVEETVDPENAFVRPATPRYMMGGLMQVMASLSGNHLQQYGLRLREIWPLFAIPLLLLAGLVLVQHYSRKLRLFLFLLLLAFPLTSTLMALQSGHTMAFNPHYGAFSAFAMAVAIVLGWRSWQAHQSIIVRYAATVLLILQGIIMAGTIWPKDRHLMAGGNPYFEAAQLIDQQYVSGDLLVTGSYFEAQMLNLYLRHRDDIPQRVDASRVHSIVLERGREEVPILKIDDPWFVADR